MANIFESRQRFRFHDPLQDRDQLTHDPAMLTVPFRWIVDCSVPLQVNARVDN
jgi:hypothetical protein